MAATLYKVFYRYQNQKTGVHITNDENEPYDPTLEFYTDFGHNIYKENTVAQFEAQQEQADMIAFANNAQNPKNNMLFVYDGCHKYIHEKWVDEAPGYILRDWQNFRDRIGNKGDYSKDFTCLNGKTPEAGGIVVCTTAVFNKNYAAYTMPAGFYKTPAEVQNIFLNSTPFDLKESNWEEHAYRLNPITQYEPYTAYSSTGKYYYTAYRAVAPNIITGNIIIGLTEEEVPEIEYLTSSGVKKTVKGVYDTEQETRQDCFYGSIAHMSSDIRTTPIPGHYQEDTAMPQPYLIKDDYKKINLSPWVLCCRCASLEAAIEKARQLVNVYGLENVKVVKNVPTDQFLRIK